MHLDLNLLTALDALLEEESVQAAADRLHLSSPAMSRTLGRIRLLTGDQVLVRTGRTMTPTPYAVGVRDQVHRLVHEVQAVLRPRRDLDLSTLRRTFTLQCHDAVTAATAPALVEVVRTAAPGVSLRFLAEPAADTDELRQGRVNLAIGSTTPAQPDTHFETLGAGQLAVVVGRGHALLRGLLDPERYAAADHVIVSRRGNLVDPVDTALAERGLHRRVVAVVPTSATAVRIVSRTDAVVAVPEGICRHLITAYNLRAVPMPFPLPPVPLIYAWHQRDDDDPAHRWLRDQVRRVLTQIW